MRALRIAILVHSTNPRGGVVHALELADALVGLGHEPVVHAPDPGGTGFFRQTRCRTVAVPAGRAPADLADLVEMRRRDYLAHFASPQARAFDVWHAHCGLSAAPLVTMKREGRIRGFVRTIHHLDNFADRRLSAFQRESIQEAERHCVVSRHWQAILARDHAVTARCVGNGVDRTRFVPLADASDEALRARLRLGSGPVFLAVGGVEARKNTVRILEAFVQVRRRHPPAQLVVAGGASLLDHGAYRRRFEELLAASRLPEGAVVLTGRLDQADMPALLRLADTLVFPSLKEGFGLVVLEAMASRTPVVTSAIAPFTEYCGAGDVTWCDPESTDSIAAAMLATLEPEVRRVLVAAGEVVADRHPWARVAQAHLATYHALAALPEPAHA